MTYHYTYMLEVKNPTDSRFRYIGVRSCNTKPEDDAYFGSCKPLKKWQAEHGTEGVIKTVLAVWKSRKDALSHEILLHDCFDIGKNPEFWNQVKQTSTGFDCTGVPKSEEHAKKIARVGEAHWSWGKKAKEETRIKMSISHSGPNNVMFGKKLPEEQKRKISAAQKGEKAWRFGKKYPEMGRAVSRALTGRKQTVVECPHCGKLGGNAMKTYHFDNCKGRLT